MCSSVVVQLLSLDLWEASCDPKADIAKRLVRRLQAGLDEWLEEHITAIVETNPIVRDKITTEIDRFIGQLAGIGSCALVYVPYTFLLFNYR